eukprot:CAMPEP_0180399268 /NCGR_PEP_ID=MMETSP0989-20121125/37074_1 /TAXON_ID=697907 /ORGANISM="non described non described, Strain CCMP2293" /LENGTH=130 /DNA_ID=CAMNT_0022401971 /DNA_START=524 /DNA_END=917 /DNA_ORIENTATION=+
MQHFRAGDGGRGGEEGDEIVIRVDCKHPHQKCRLAREEEREEEGLGREEEEEGEEVLREAWGPPLQHVGAPRPGGVGESSEGRVQHRRETASVTRGAAISPASSTSAFPWFETRQLHQSSTTPYTPGPPV